MTDIITKALEPQTMIESIEPAVSVGEQITTNLINAIKAATAQTVEEAITKMAPVTGIETALPTRLLQEIESRLDHDDDVILRWLNEKIEATPYSDLAFDDEVAVKRAAAELGMVPQGGVEDPLTGAALHAVVKRVGVSVVMAASLSVDAYGVLEAIEVSDFVDHHGVGEVAECCLSDDEDEVIGQIDIDHFVGHHSVGDVAAACISQDSDRVVEALSETIAEKVEEKLTTLDASTLAESVSPWTLYEALGEAIARL